MKFADKISGKTLNKCPRCGAKLVQSRLRDSLINRCSQGCGVWIDQDQLDRVAGGKSSRYEITSDLPPQLEIRRGPF